MVLRQPRRRPGLTGALGPEEVLAGLRRHYREVALTLGEDGALFWRGTELLRCPADRAAVVDTTGAGDAFTGTFLARRLRGDGPGPALRAALAAAAQVVATPGPAPGTEVIRGCRGRRRTPAA